jgi:hypothetical protein
MLPCVCWLLAQDADVECVTQQADGARSALMLSMVPAKAVDLLVRSYLMGGLVGVHTPMDV